MEYVIFFFFFTIFKWMYDRRKICILKKVSPLIILLIAYCTQLVFVCLAIMYNNSLTQFHRLSSNDLVFIVGGAAIFTGVGYYYNHFLRTMGVEQYRLIMIVLGLLTNGMLIYMTGTSKMTYVRWMGLLMCITGAVLFIKN